MQNVTFFSDKPLNRLYFAINHYVSTGDHIGEGVSMPEGPQRHPTGEPHPDDKIRIVILVNSTNPTDIADFEKFQSRFSQIAPRFKTQLMHAGKQQHFLVKEFVIRYGQADELARALTEEPGPLGWGSMKDLIEKHFPG